MTSTEKIYDVAIIGAGASGAALAYTLAQYSSISDILVVEKYSTAGQVNSKASNNSQTLHVGDIETNYSLEKVRQVYPAAMMMVRYAQQVSQDERDRFLFPTPKMVLAVGNDEVQLLEQRYHELSPLFPDLEKLDRAGIEQVEPAVIRGRNQNTPLLALYTKNGFAVDFERFAQQAINHAQQLRPDIDVLFNTHITNIERQDEHYILFKGDTIIGRATVLVVNADSYSLLLAQQLGYGAEFSLIPIAGTFYFSRKILNGKVYTVQNPKLPFAAVHGDPDINSKNGETRWGPTARFHPVLEARNRSTFWDFLKSSGLQRFATWRSFVGILFDPARFRYLLENMLYELPWIGKRMFIKNVRKIVPNMRARDVHIAHGYGGMRLQRVDTNTRQMLLGEGKITGNKAIFNMTPSPGASVSLYNAMRDAETIAQFLGNASLFDSARMHAELFDNAILQEHDVLPDVSQSDTYVS